MTERTVSSFSPTFQGNPSTIILFTYQNRDRLEKKVMYKMSLTNLYIIVIIWHLKWKSSVVVCYATGYEFGRANHLSCTLSSTLSQAWGILQIFRLNNTMTQNKTIIMIIWETNFSKPTMNDVRVLCNLQEILPTQHWYNGTVSCCNRYLKSV